MRCLFLLCFWFSSLSLCSQIIPEYSVTVLNEGSVGYYFFTAVKTGNLSSSYNTNHIILDGKCYPVYFKQLKKGRTTADFKIQPNGLMSYFDTDKFYFMDSTFQITDSMTWKNGALKDAHDLQITQNGHYLMLGQKEIKQNLNTHHLFKKSNSPGDTGLKVKIGVVRNMTGTKTSYLNGTVQCTSVLKIWILYMP